MARRGIVLITTLLMTVLVVMLVTVVVYTGAGGLSLSGNFYEREAALLAADSGLQYAMARLQDRADWRGDQPETAPEPRPDFSVIEQDGNVYGFLSTLYGHKSQFRIKFNYEDGDGGEDGLPNTADSTYVLPTSLVSLNNLTGSSSVSIRRANADGRGVSEDASPYVVPRRTACVIVEGVAGWGVRDTDTTDPNGFLSNRAVTRRVVEAYLALDETGDADSAAYAAGTLTANLKDGKTFEVSSVSDEEAPRIRSLEDITVQGQNGGDVYYSAANGEVVVGNGHGFTVNGDVPEGVTITQSDSSDQFKRLTWEGIEKASSGSSTDAQVPGGLYVWRLEADGTTPYLEYFDQEYTDGMTLPDAGTGTRVDTGSITSRGTGVTVDTESLAIDLSNNVFVATSEGGSKGFAVVPDAELTQGGLRPAVTFTPADGSLQAPILTASGSVQLQGSASGYGSITSEGNISFQGPSVIEADPETGVSLYAKGDITVKATPNKVAEKQNDFVQAMATVLGRYEKNGGDMDALFHAIVEGDLSQLSSADRATFQDAYESLGSKKQKQFSKLWQKGLRGATEAERTAFMERVTQRLTSSAADGADQSLTGVLYTWGNFTANMGSKGRLHLRGTMIAYGGNPDDDPGTAGTGRIDITAKEVEFLYDPTYIRELVGETEKVKVKRTLWATW